jgi:DNA-binding transcriptional MerR regulator
MTNRDRDRDRDAWLSTGEFAQRTRLSRKALRVYERAGLLRAAAIDPDTGYRRYAPGQVRTGQLIGLLRGAELGLAEIRLVLHDLSRDRLVAAARLDRILADTHRRHGDRVLVIRHVQATLRSGDHPMFEISTRHVPARRLMSMQRRLHADQTDGFVAEAKAAFTRHLDGSPAAGPLSLIFHGIVDHGDNDGPLEVVLGCGDDVAPSEGLGIRVEPAHDEAYTTITKAQWAYPAILAAYDAVACCLEATARSGSELSCREVYLAEPDAIGLDEPICDIAYPLAARP